MTLLSFASLAVALLAPGGRSPMVKTRETRLSVHSRVLDGAKLTRRGSESIFALTPQSTPGEGAPGQSRPLGARLRGTSLTLSSTRAAAAGACARPGQWTECAASITATAYELEYELNVTENRLGGEIKILETRLREFTDNLEDASRPITVPIYEEDGSDFWIGLGLGGAAVAALIGGIALLN